MHLYQSVEKLKLLNAQKANIRLKMSFFFNNEFLQIIEASEVMFIHLLTYTHAYLCF